jgi:hypothetical protein
VSSIILSAQNTIQQIVKRMTDPKNHLSSSVIIITKWYHGDANPIITALLYRTTSPDQVYPYFLVVII